MMNIDDCLAPRPRINSLSAQARWEPTSAGAATPRWPGALVVALLFWAGPVEAKNDPTEHLGATEIQGRIGLAKHGGSMKSVHARTYLNVGPIRVGAELTPWAAARPNYRTYEWFGSASWETRWLGLGAQAGTLSPWQPDRLSPDHLFVFGPQLRVGKQEGFHFSGRLNFGALDDDPWGVKSARVALQVPVIGPVLMVGASQASASGYSVLEMGPRLRLGGQGGPGTLYLTGLVGSWIMTRRETESVWGWHIGLGIEARY